MKKNKVDRMFKTFPFNEVFSSRVYVDVNNDVIYDKEMGVAIAYIHKTHTHMDIMFVLPDVADNDFEDKKISLSAFFNKDNVVEKAFAKFYFRVKNGYYYLGHPYQDTNYRIRLPRLFDPDSVTNETRTGSAGGEDFDEDSLDEPDLFDIDPDEFTANADELFNRLID